MGNEQGKNVGPMDKDLQRKVYTHSKNFQINEDNENTKHEFTICSFNIWCPFWNDADGVEAKSIDRWKKRNNDILQALSSDIKHKSKSDPNEEKVASPDNDIADIPSIPSINADIYCIQEYWCDNKDFRNLYTNYLSKRNYKIIYLTRTSSRKPDGVAMIINTKKFKIIQKYDIEYSSSNRIAIIMILQHIKSGINIAIGNTHFTFPTSYNGSSRKLQCNQFVQFMNKYGATNKISMNILCGDYNCDINQTEAILCLNYGYKSSFHVCNAEELNGDKGNIKCISHLTHNRTQVFVDHIFYKGNKNVDDKNKFAFKPIDSYLYPRNVSYDKWPRKSEYDLSDHRPLVTTFQIQKM